MNNSLQPGKFERSWQLLQSSWRVLKLEKELVVLPLVEMITSLAALVLVAAMSIFAVVAQLEGWVGLRFTESWAFLPVIIYIVLVTFVANLFTGAVLHAAFERFGGNDPTASGSLRVAWTKRRAIAKFSLLSATVGLVIQLISDRLPFAGKLVGFIGDAAWAVATFFALPYIVRSEQDLGPIKATKESVELIKKVWGESLVVSAGIGLIAGLGLAGYSLIGVAVTIGLASVSSLAAVIFASFAFVGLFGLGLIVSVLSTIAKAATFYWATTGEAPENFNRDLLHAAMTTKKARGIFGA